MFICSLGVKIWFHFNLMYTNLVLMQDRERKRDIKCKSQKEIWQLLLKNNLKWTLYWKKMTIKCWERFYVGFFFSLSSKMLTRMLRIQSVGDREMDQNVCDVLNTIKHKESIVSCHHDNWDSSPPYRVMEWTIDFGHFNDFLEWVAYWTDKIFVLVEKKRGTSWSCFTQTPET